jgi:xanthine dehydrogenase molybdenum-binding subunit
MADSNTAGTNEFRVIGTRPIRHDGIDKVTGRAKYGADYSFPGMLHGKVLRSPHAHALIKSINCDKARELTGVHAVITRADFPEVSEEYVIIGAIEVNIRNTLHNLMARDKVLYDGHAVAAVAAINPHIAEEALRLIEVDYEVMPPVMTLAEAMEPEAPIVFPELRSKLVQDRSDAGKIEGPDRASNIAKHIQFTRGDLAAGFNAADLIVEREFKTSAVHPGYIEPHNAVAIYNPDGGLTIYTSTQSTFMVRGQTAYLLGIPEGNIRVVPAEIGGGFGGKLYAHLEPLAALLSSKTGRPVKMVMSRAEVLRASGPTSGTWIKGRIGATRDGKLTAAEIWMAYEAGAFPGSSPFVGGALTAFGPYNIANLRIDAYDVVLNRPKIGSYRAPGAPTAAYACESLVDEMAEKCAIDPIDFRIMNGSREGTPQPSGPLFKRIGYLETCEAIRNSAHYRSQLAGKYRGRGVASGFWGNAGLQSSAAVNIHADGTVSVITGSVDIGGSRAAMAMVAAEVFGLDSNDVRPLVVDTDSIGYTDLTGGSRVAMATGLAVYEASLDALRQLKQRAAKLWEKKPEDVEFDRGTFRARDNGVPPMTLKQLAGRLARTGGPVTGCANLNAGAASGVTFATVCVDVEVDPDTGKVQILRCTTSQDAGRAIHPSYVEGQAQGSVAQGIGWALSEEYIYDEKGVLRNTAFLDYRMPTCLDLPMIETIIVEVANPNHPLGVRGQGEIGIVPVLAAVANAVSHAIGVRMTELPMSPPRVLKAIQSRAASAASETAAAD